MRTLPSIGIAGRLLAGLLLISCVRAPTPTSPPEYNPHSLTAYCFSNSTWDPISTTGTLISRGALLSFKADVGAAEGGHELLADMPDRLGEGVAWEIIGRTGTVPENYELRIRAQGWVSGAVSACPRMPQLRLIFIRDLEPIPLSERR